MLDKLQALEEKYEELTREMSDPDIFNDPQAYNKLAKAHADLGKLWGNTGVPPGAAGFRRCRADA